MMLQSATAAPDLDVIDPRVEQGDAETGSFRTHYYAAGSADAPTVLLHDGRVGRRRLRDVLWRAAPPRADYRADAPDTLGFGRSDKAVSLHRAPVDSPT